jgi:hypothetical protein
MKHISYVFIFILLSLTCISATDIKSLPYPIKQNNTANLIQGCDGSTYSNITSILYPNTLFALIGEYPMNVSSDDNYNFSFTDTQSIGKYIVYGHCDENGVDTNWAYDFEVTPSGFINSIYLYVIILFIFGAIIILGFSIKEAWFVVFGGLGLIMLGIYSINNGVVGFKDMFMTWAISLFEIGIGAFLSIGSAWQKIEYD